MARSIYISENLTGEYPFNECAKCKGLEDCPAVEVLDDMMGSPAPPNGCPRGMEVVSKRHNDIKKKERCKP